MVQLNKIGTPGVCKVCINQTDTILTEYTVHHTVVMISILYNYLSIYRTTKILIKQHSNKIAELNSKKSPENIYESILKMYIFINVSDN